YLKMSYPSKVTLLGSVIFTFQHTKHLAMSKHNLMFLYTIFIVSTKITMMTVPQTSTMPFASFEDILSRMLFGWPQLFSSCEKKSDAKPSSNGTDTLASKPVDVASDNIKRKCTKNE
ncbi:trimeric intracellular cation channel type B-like, partial [Carlito syrichta]|uniref:Trimeric intracellular cation channel type B-like n=1 Tax=Carlito syrichta TaxID=1868482 RepID=A0A3Q0DUL4_CARSF